MSIVYLLAELEELLNAKLISYEEAKQRYDKIIDLYWSDNA